MVDGAHIADITIPEMVADHTLFVTFVAGSLKQGAERMQRIEGVVKEIRTNGCNKQAEHEHVKTMAEAAAELAATNQRKVTEHDALMASIAKGMKGPRRKAHAQGGSVGGAIMAFIWLMVEFLPSLYARIMARVSGG